MRNHPDAEIVLSVLGLDGPGARLEAISGTAVASSSSVRTAVTSHALGISPRAWRLVGVFGDRSRRVR